LIFNIEETCRGVKRGKSVGLGYSTSCLKFNRNRLTKLYKQSLAKFAKESLANFEECSVEEHLRHAFIRLDHDIMSEGLPFGHGIGLNEQA
jgi:hypothetical protein